MEPNVSTDLEHFAPRSRISRRLRAPEFCPFRTWTVLGAAGDQGDFVRALDRLFRRTAFRLAHPKSVWTPTRSKNDQVDFAGEGVSSQKARLHGFRAGGLLHGGSHQRLPPCSSIKEASCRSDGSPKEDDTQRHTGILAKGLFAQ